MMFRFAEGAGRRARGQHEYWARPRQARDRTPSIEPVTVTDRPSSSFDAAAGIYRAAQEAGDVMSRTNNNSAPSRT